MELHKLAHVVDSDALDDAQFDPCGYTYNGRNVWLHREIDGFKRAAADPILHSVLNGLHRADRYRHVLAVWF